MAGVGSDFDVIIRVLISGLADGVMIKVCGSGLGGGVSIKVCCEFITEGVPLGTAVSGTTGGGRLAKDGSIGGGNIVPLFSAPTSYIKQNIFT